jgi:hypothetical protein
MVTEVRPVQFKNAPFPILITLSGMVMEVRPVQPANTELPIVVTLLGMVTEDRSVQPSNARFPIEVMPSLMMTVVMEALTLYHGTLLALFQLVIDPVPLMVSVPSFKVAVTSAALGQPISQGCALVFIVANIKPQSRINFFMVLYFYGLVFAGFRT